MATEGGGADEQCIALLNGLEQGVRFAEFAVEAVDPHAGASDSLADGIGDGSGVSVSAGVQQGHLQLGSLLGFPPAAVVRQQAAPAVVDGRSVARSDAADR